MKFNNDNIEKAVLGSLISFNNLYYKHSDAIHRDLFLDEFNKWIFDMIITTASSSKLDILTVTQQAMDNAGTMPRNYKDVSIAYELSEMINISSSDLNFDEHLDILKDLSSRRKLYSSCKTVTDMFSKDSFNMDKAISYITTELLEIGNGKQDKEKTAKDCIELFNAEQKKELSDVVLQTDFKEIDEIIGGFEYSDLVIIAGAASMGKTSLAIIMLKNMILKSDKVGVISLEMNDIQLMYRLLSVMTDVPFKRIKWKTFDNVEKVKVRGAISRLEKCEFYLDNSTTELKSVVNRIKKWKIRYGVEIVIIDYLQLIQCSGKGNREQEVATIARTLKNVARELDIVIVALSQLSRAVSSRDDKRPTLSDLRESGEIEQAADTVMFCFRQSYYDDIGNTDVQDAEIIIAKGRNVGTGVALAKFNPPLTKWISASDVKKEQASENALTSEEGLPF